ncbi:MAG: rhomboid family intramembrane serine protease [Limnothrix sp. RL_2_0]|nr:rhomboid family intramembrane serine protease [Limnothrix sp. RL_2_0]
MQWAAIVGLMAWGILIVIPSLGVRRIQALLYGQQFRQAYYWSLVLRFFHPFDTWWEQPKIIQALRLGQQGEFAKAKAILDHYGERPGFVAQQAIAMYYAMRFDWSGLLGWLGTKSTPSRDPLLRMYYCRALGETGHLHELLLAMQPSKKILLKVGDRRTFHLVQLFASAFCGEVKLTEALLSGCLAFYPDDIKKFWVAIAWYCAGEKRVGEKQLKTLLDQPDQDFTAAIQARIQSPPQPAQPILKSESYPLIAQLSRDIRQENIERSYQSLIERRAFFQQGLSVNTVLVVLNCVVFLVGIVMNFKIGRDALLDLGGFTPNAVWAGEWWRLFTATFIHVNWGHLLTNIFTLYLLGGFVEKHLGKWRYLFIYLVSGVGAMVILLGLVTITQGIDFNVFPRWFQFLTDEIRYSYRLWVGASGSIMGMIGAIAAVLFRGWQRDESKLALRQFRLVLLIIVIQFSVDLSSTNVSFYSHFLGLILGASLTLLLTHKIPQTAPKLSR